MGNNLIGSKIIVEKFNSVYYSFYMKLTVIIEKDEEGYFAYCPELKGCMSEGDTFDEAMANIIEAIKLYLETLSQEEKEELSRKEIHTSTVEVQVA